MFKKPGHLLLLSALLLAQAVAQSLTQPPSAAPTLQPAEEPVTGLEEGGVGAESSGPDSNAGASGNDTGAITLSKGGIAAIIAVVVVVVVLGGQYLCSSTCRLRLQFLTFSTVISVVLYFVAKRRQWKVRESIRRASRRLTGRSGPTKSQRQSKRTPVRMDVPQSSKVSDIEKGRVETKVESVFDVDSPKAKSWKSKMVKPAGTRPNP